MRQDNRILTDIEGFQSLLSPPEQTARPQGSPRPLRVDGHVDIPYHLMSLGDSSSFRALETGPFTPAKALASGVRLFGTALYCQDAFNGQTAMGHFQEVLHFTLQCFSQEDILRGSEDLTRLRDDPNGLGTLLLLENADVLAGNVAYVETLREQGIHILSLTHAGQNRLADGNAVAYPDGLTRDGEEVIRAVADQGLILDVAHLHAKCFWQVVSRYDGRLIDSHTGARQLHDTPRNIDAEQAKEILDRKGVIGVTLNPEMLSPEGKASVDDVFAHMDTFVQRLGPSLVGIGSDFFGFDRPTRGMEDITQLPALVERMMSHGYDDPSIHAILGQNWVRVYEEILTGR